MSNKKKIKIRWKKNADFEAERWAVNEKVKQWYVLSSFI